MGRVWFRARSACPSPFPVPVCGVGVRAGPGSRLCPALLGWVVGVCFLRFFFFLLCGVGCSKKKHPHGSLIKDSIATKMKGYLFEDAFPKRIVNKIFDNSIS